METDVFVKSRHPGFVPESFRVCFCNVLEKKDSRQGESPRMTGQAGMTVSRYYGTFYESAKIHTGYCVPQAEGFSAILLKTALLVMAVFCLSLFSCAPKEVIRRAGPAPYGGMVTVEALQQSVGFGNVRSIKALAEVTVYKQGANQGSMNGVVGYKAPRKMRIDLFGPFGLTVTELLISGDLLQVSVPKKNILYEWNAPEVSFTGLMKGAFRYEMAEEGDMHVLIAYSTDEHNSEVAAKYYFDRTYLLNRAISLYKDGPEVIKAEFDNFNGRVPESITITLSSGLAINIVLQESEFDTDIPDEYFKTIEHGGKQIKPFEELLKTPFGKPAGDLNPR